MHCNSNLNELSHAAILVKQIKDIKNTEEIGLNWKKVRALANWYGKLSYTTV